MAKALVLALALAGQASAAVVGRKSFLGNGMQPEVVARTLSHVEDEWKAQAAVFTECNSTSGLEGATIVNCADAPSSFAKSCGTVVGAIIQGSGGDRDVAKEYMADVCTQRAISGWHQQQCNALATAVRGAMTADKYENREGFNTVKLCNGFWSRFLSEERARVVKEKAEHEAAQKKADEEAAAAAKVQQEALKKEAEKKAAEEAQRKEEEAKAKAAEAAAEAKAKAAEAAEHAAQKKVEAEQIAQAAKVKMEEAEAAEHEHTKAVAKVASMPTTAAAATAEAKAPQEQKAQEQKVKATATSEAKAPQVEKVKAVPEATKMVVTTPAVAKMPVPAKAVAATAKETPAATTPAKPAAAKPAAAKAPAEKVAAPKAF